MCCVSLGPSLPLLVTVSSCCAWTDPCWEWHPGHAGPQHYMATPEPCPSLPGSSEVHLLLDQQASDGPCWAPCGSFLPKWRRKWVSITNGSPSHPCRSRVSLRAAEAVLGWVVRGEAKLRCSPVGCPLSCQDPEGERMHVPLVWTCESLTWDTCHFPLGSSSDQKPSCNFRF